MHWEVLIYAMLCGAGDCQCRRCQPFCRSSGLLSLWFKRHRLLLVLQRAKMTDYAQEQADELEALTSIFMDDLEGGQQVQPAFPCSTATGALHKFMSWCCGTVAQQDHAAVPLLPCLPIRVACRGCG